MRFFVLGLLTLLIMSSMAYAHIPEIVTENRNYTAEPVIVNEPEISYAYYGKLQGSPHQYKIISEEPFNLYVSLLVPYVGQPETSDVEFHIMKDGEKIVMKHDFQNWTKWYEEYGGDWYLQGPEYENGVEPGTYIIEVHSDTNLEDYTLAIGKEERFGAGEIFQTILVLPAMKALFWGNYSLVAFIIIVIGAVILYFYFRKGKKKGKRR